MEDNYCTQCGRKRPIGKRSLICRECQEWNMKQDEEKEKIIDVSPKTKEASEKANREMDEEAKAHRDSKIQTVTYPRSHF